MKKGIIGFILGILATIGAQYVFPEYTTLNNGSGAASSDSTIVKDSTNIGTPVAAYPAPTSIDTLKVKNDSIGSK